MVAVEPRPDFSLDKTMNDRRDAFLSLGCVLALVLFVSGGSFAARGLAGEDADARKSLNFAIGVQPEGGTVAQVVVEDVVRPEARRGLLKIIRNPAPVVTGVAVRFEQIEAGALDEIPPVIKALTKAQAVQWRRLSFYAPGDPVPRLMADEVLVKAPGEWRLKRVLLADRPSAPECKLVWSRGQARLAFPGGEALVFKDLLAPRENR